MHACLVRNVTRDLARFLVGVVRDGREALAPRLPTCFSHFPVPHSSSMHSPAAAQHVVLYLPMVNGVEYLREGYFGSQIVAHYDVGYMALVNATLTLLGLAVTRKIGRVVVPE